METKPCSRASADASASCDDVVILEDTYSPGTPITPTVLEGSVAKTQLDSDLSPSVCVPSEPKPDAPGILDSEIQFESDIESDPEEEKEREDDQVIETPLDGAEPEKLLRRCDQLSAAREDSPPRKGKGRGRGRGKAKENAGKGRGKGRGRPPKKAHDQAEQPAETKQPRKRRAKSDPPVEPKPPAETDDTPVTVAEKPKRKRKIAPKDDEADAEVSEPKKCTRKTKNAAASDADAGTVDPAPKKKARKAAPKSATDSAGSSAPSAPSAAEPKTPKKVSPRAITGKKKEDLKKLIKVFSYSYVVPYWSRAAVGLKIPKEEGGLSQADF